MIYKNSALCLKCGDTLTSRHCHDFKRCKCGNVSIDGGLEYLRWMVKDYENFVNLSECDEEGDE